MVSEVFAYKVWTDVELDRSDIAQALVQLSIDNGGQGGIGVAENPD